MKPWAMWIGVLLLTCVAGVFVWSSRSKASEHHRTKGDPTAKRFERLEAELRENRANLSLLASQRVAAAVPAASVDQANPDAAASASQSDSAEERQGAETDGPQADYPEEREVAFFTNYFSELDSTMKGQTRDPQLKSQVSQIVQDAFNKSGKAEIVDINCTIQLCRLELRYQHEDRRERDRFLNDLRDKLTPLLDQATIHLPTAEKRMTAYFSKQGSRLPRPTVSFDAFMRGDEG
jgi:hypothetical protein